VQDLVQASLLRREDTDARSLVQVLPVTTLASQVSNVCSEKIPLILFRHTGLVVVTNVVEEMLHGLNCELFGILCPGFLIPFVMINAKRMCTETLPETIWSDLN
jgi:hypothetical protein